MTLFSSRFSSMIVCAPWDSRNSRHVSSFSKPSSSVRKRSVTLAYLFSVSAQFNNQWRCDSPSGDVSESTEAFTLDKHVHKVAAHVLGCEIELEKLMIVAKGQGGSNIKCMFDPGL
jgi:hypothetical protein